MEKTPDGWIDGTHTISAPKEKLQKPTRLMESIGGLSKYFLLGFERAYKAYVSPSHEDWETANPIIMNLL